MGSGNNETLKSHLWLRKHVIWCKDRQNRCIRCGDIAIFDIFKMAAVRHLGFVGVRNWTTHEVYLVVFTIVQNLVGIDAVGLIL